MDRFYLGSVGLGLLKLVMFFAVQIGGFLLGYLQPERPSGVTSKENEENKSWVSFIAATIIAVLGILHGIWALLDMAIVLHNGLDKSTSIHTFGFHADFGHKQVEASYLLSFIGIVAMLLVVAFPAIALIMNTFNNLKATCSGKSDQKV